MKKNLLMLGVCLMFVSLFTIVTNVYGIQIEESTAELKLTVTKSPETLTNKDVTVTISSTFSGDINISTPVSSYELAEIDGWTLSEDKHSLTKVFKSNTDVDENVKVTVAKANGNTYFDAKKKEDTAIVSVTNIDKVVPVVKQDKKENEDGSVDVFLTVEDEHINEALELEGWTKEEETEDNKVVYKKTYTESTNDEVIVTDLADNSTTVEIAIDIKKDNNESNSNVQDETNNNVVNNTTNTVDNSGNPETSDIVVYFVVALVLATVVLIIAKRHYNSKINNN